MNHIPEILLISSCVMSLIIFYGTAIVCIMANKRGDKV